MEGGTKTGDIDNIFGGRLRAAFSFVFAPKIGALPQRRLGCLLMAQSGHADMLNQCPLLGVKQTSCRGLAVLRDSDLAAIRRGAAIVLTPALCGLAPSPPADMIFAKDSRSR